MQYSIDTRVQTTTGMPPGGVSPPSLPPGRSSGLFRKIKRPLVLLAMLLSAPSPIYADARFDTFFASSIKWKRDPIGNWNVDFVPMDTAKYAYEIQVAGKGNGDPGNKKPGGVLACTKFAASYRDKLDVKDVNGEIGISNPKAFEAKISGHANSVDVFGGFYNRVPAPWYQPTVLEEVHLRVAVYEQGHLAYTTAWYGAPSGDILNWKWPAACSWVQIQK